MYFLSSRHWPIPGVFLRVRTFSNDVKHWTVSLRQRSFFDDNDEVCCWSSGFVTMFVSLFATLHETCKIHGGNDSEIMTLNLPGGSTLQWGSLHVLSMCQLTHTDVQNIPLFTLQVAPCNIRLGTSRLLDVWVYAQSMCQHNVSVIG